MQTSKRTSTSECSSISGLTAFFMAICNSLSVNFSILNFPSTLILCCYWMLGAIVTQKSANFREQLFLIHSLNELRTGLTNVTSIHGSYTFALFWRVFLFSSSVSLYLSNWVTLRLLLQQENLSSDCWLLHLIRRFHQFHHLGCSLSVGILKLSSSRNSVHRNNVFLNKVITIVVPPEWFSLLSSQAISDLQPRLEISVYSSLSSLENGSWQQAVTSVLPRWGPVCWHWSP